MAHGTAAELSTQSVVDVGVPPSSEGYKKDRRVSGFTLHFGSHAFFEGKLQCIQGAKKRYLGVSRVCYAMLD